MARLSMEDDFAELKSQGLRALADSMEQIGKALALGELPSKYEVIWLAYSNAELGIGVLKLIDKESGDRVGSFRKIRRTRKGNSSPSLEGDLLDADRELKESIRSFDEEGSFELGLEHARKARDVLKLILLEGKRQK